jgi:hypothetical protein
MEDNPNWHSGSCKPKVRYLNRKLPLVPYIFPQKQCCYHLREEAGREPLTLTFALALALAAHGKPFPCSLLWRKLRAGLIAPWQDYHTLCVTGGNGWKTGSIVEFACMIDYAHPIDPNHYTSPAIKAPLCPPICKRMIINISICHRRLLELQCT